MTGFDIEHIIPDIVYFVNRRSTPAWKIERSTIDFHDLTCVYSGHATYVVNGAEYRLGRGDFIYIPRGSVREAFNDPSDLVQSLAVNFNLGPVSGGYTKLPFPTLFSFALNNRLAGLYEELEAAWAEKNPGYLMKSRALFMLILHGIISGGSFNRCPAPSDPRVDKVREYIIYNYRSRIKMEDLAAVAGLNPVYLGALFLKVTNSTVKEYINRIRINNAENLLSAGSCSVSEAAAQCGFEDIYYFSKVFKSVKGFPPSRIIKVKA